MAIKISNIKKTQSIGSQLIRKLLCPLEPTHIETIVSGAEFYLRHLQIML